VEKDFILAIDQGTTGTRCILFDSSFRGVHRAYQEHPQIYPRPGWVEHDLEAVWKSVRETAALALKSGSVDPGRIAAIGITNQRETTCVWDRDGGRPAGNAIVWQDRRTAGMCDDLRRQGKEETIQKLTGLLLDPYFSGTKLSWMLENIPEIRKGAESGRMAFGTVDSFLLYRLTGGRVHATDVSNASRTLLFNLEAGRWDPELLEIFRVPEGILPRVGDSAGVAGETRGLDFLPDGIPIAGIAGDQQAALFGQQCFAPRTAKLTLGTGSFLLVNLGPDAIRSRHRMLTTIAWKLASGKIQYAIEGSAFIAGAQVQWLRDGLQIISRADEVEALAGSVSDSAGLVVVPALVGLGAPYWKPEARGLIAGIGRDTTRAHLARASLEGIALINVDLIDAVAEDIQDRPLALNVDGGAAANDLLCRMIADFSGLEVARPDFLETTARGAAMLAGMGVGWLEDLSGFDSIRQKTRRFPPEMDEHRRKEVRERWKEVVRKA